MGVLFNVSPYGKLRLCSYCVDAQLDLNLSYRQVALYLLSWIPVHLNKYSRLSFEEYSLPVNLRGILNFIGILGQV